MRTLFALVLILLTSFTLKAQQTAKITINTPTVHCEECKNRIIKYVGRELGVQKVEVDWRKGITKVQYIPHRINPETIRVNIANLGYDADDEERLEEAFKKLPKACQIDRKKE
ncbi:heavy-metal-associated domain-containing protein [Gynurincola endophyticus]|uniref:heavy-metal-associated domain-containing protein n=1 Tax=Gynurincola endophyticus TaxID=2479004 RepID=UPI000F8C7FDB|nr:heavy-metal-associated domain-containing protein [Gynurincola endophyticus]